MRAADVEAYKGAKIFLMDDLFIPSSEVAATRKYCKFIPYEKDSKSNLSTTSNLWEIEKLGRFLPVPYPVKAMLGIMHIILGRTSMAAAADSSTHCFSSLL